MPKPPIHALFCYNNAGLWLGEGRYVCRKIELNILSKLCGGIAKHVGDKRGQGIRR